MTRRRWIIAGTAVVVVLAAAFAVFRPDKLFTDDVVDEQLDADVAAVIGGTTVQTAPVPTPAAEDAATPADPEPPAEDVSTTTAPAVLGQGEFVSQGGHTVNGAAFVVGRPEGRLLVLPELDSENGPDLHLYLSPVANGSVDGGVYLEPLEGNQGTQTYELPADVDLSVQRNVVIWCERFSTPFGTATLA